MSAYSSDAELVGMAALSLVLICPDEQRRNRIAKAMAGTQATVACELARYPGIDDLTIITEGDYDAVIIDLDPDPERALDVVENLCASSTRVTVMVYSARSDHDLLVRCMRAGAREFLDRRLWRQITWPRLWSELPPAATKGAVRRRKSRANCLFSPAPRAAQV